MTNLNWIIRTTLISCIVAVAVYAHSRSHNLVIERFHKIAYADPNTHGVTVGWGSRLSKIRTMRGSSKNYRRGET